MRVQSLAQEEPLEKEMATHSSIFAWKILWTEEPGRLLSVRSQRIRQDCSNCSNAQTTAQLPHLTH